MGAAARSLGLLLGTHCASQASAEDLHSTRLNIDGSNEGGFVAEPIPGSSQSVRKLAFPPPDGDDVAWGVSLEGPNRLYAITDYVWSQRWRDISYKKFHLNNQAISFDVDLSDVYGCRPRTQCTTHTVHPSLRVVC